MRFPGAGAERLIREGIKRFNETAWHRHHANGRLHETMTLFWISIVRNYLEEVRREKLAVLPLFNKLIERCGRELPFEYYSRERLMSAEARASWVEPDRKELP
jgi:hypothetical protein